MTQNMLFHFDRCLLHVRLTASGCFFDSHPFCFQSNRTTSITQFIYGVHARNKQMSIEKFQGKCCLKAADRNGENTIKRDIECQNDCSTNCCLFTSYLFTDKNAIGRFDVLKQSTEWLTKRKRTRKCALCVYFLYFWHRNKTEKNIFGLPSICLLQFNGNIQWNVITVIWKWINHQNVVPLL